MCEVHLVDIYSIIFYGYQSLAPKLIPYNFNLELLNSTPWANHIVDEDIYDTSVESRMKTFLPQYNFNVSIECLKKQIKEYETPNNNTSKSLVLYKLLERLSYMEIITNRFRYRTDKKYFKEICTTASYNAYLFLKNSRNIVSIKKTLGIDVDTDYLYEKVLPKDISRRDIDELFYKYKISDIKILFSFYISMILLDISKAYPHHGHFITIEKDFYNLDFRTMSELKFDITVEDKGIDITYHITSTKPYEVIVNGLNHGNTTKHTIFTSRAIRTLRRALYYLELDEPRMVFNPMINKLSPSKVEVDLDKSQFINGIYRIFMKIDTSDQDKYFLERSKELMDKRTKGELL